eukprot:scaffold19818_cov63-Phaeocystis_antarctica.AAC.7
MCRNQHSTCALAPFGLRMSSLPRTWLCGRLRRSNAFRGGRKKPLLLYVCVPHHRDQQIHQHDVSKNDPEHQANPSEANLKPSRQRGCGLPAAWPAADGLFHQKGGRINGHLEKELGHVKHNLRLTAVVDGRVLPCRVPLDV